MGIEKILHARRRSPRHNFAEQLWTGLEANERRHRQRMINRRPILWAVISLCTVVTLLFIASPDVRAQVEQWTRTVLQLGDVRLNIINRITVSSSAGSAVPVETMSLVEAQAVIPFRVPQWSPDGFTLDETVSVIHYSEREIGTGVTWRTTDDTMNDAKSLVLTIFNNDQPGPVVGMTHDAQTIHINGTQGVLYSGSWDAGRFGGTSRHLVWTQDGLSYFLSAEGVSDGDLIHIAESVG